jgi:methyl-accepting chemotaxis protein
VAKHWLKYKALLDLTLFTRLEQALVLIGLCGTGLVVSDLLRSGMTAVGDWGGLLLAGSGMLFWRQAWRHRMQRQAPSPPKTDAGMLQSMAALDEQMRQQLDRAVSLSETSSLNTAARVTDLHALAGQLVDYLSGAKQQSDAMQEMIELNGSIATEFTHFVQALPQQIAQERDHLARLVTDVQQLSSISETIRDMARQTEILSINAAIAAAHAGESGRAFAVLASEVRRLALESSTSAQTIEQKIHRLVDTVQARMAGESAQRMQHNEREIARLLTLTGKFDEGYLDMRQFYTMLLTAITEHNTRLLQGILSLLDAGQYHDVFKQIIGRQAPVFEQRHALLDDLLAQVHSGKPDMAALDARAQALLTQYMASENAHRPPDLQADRSADQTASPPHIELF